MYGSLNKRVNELGKEYYYRVIESNFERLICVCVWGGVDVVLFCFVFYFLFN